jgi:hypothetical protein
MDPGGTCGQLADWVVEVFMFFRDLTAYEYQVPRKAPNVLMIGWLDDNTEFERAEADAPFLNALRSLYPRHQVNKMRGYHKCQLCHTTKNKGVMEASIDGDLGSAELWIPSSDKSAIFAAPDMIIHYIETHQYSPPTSYKQAVIQAAGNLCWNATEECERALNSAYQS